MYGLETGSAAELGNISATGGGYNLWSQLLQMAGSGNQDTGGKRLTRGAMALGSGLQNMSYGGGGAQDPGGRMQGFLQNPSVTLPRRPQMPQMGVRRVNSDLDTNSVMQLLRGR